MARSPRIGTTDVQPKTWIIPDNERSMKYAIKCMTKTTQKLMSAITQHGRPKSHKLKHNALYQIY